MRARDKRGAYVRRRHHTAEIHGPVRVTMPAIRAVCGDRWSWDCSARCLRVPIEFADDLEAALTAQDQPARSRSRKAAVATSSLNDAPAVLW